MKAKLTLLLGCLLGICCHATQAAPIPTKPVYTNKTRFRIPYRFDAAEMQRLGSREIRLYVSVDQGLHWQHVQSVPPQQGRFEFQAPRDGAYWFAVKTVDKSNQLHPGGETTQAGLRVVVDTRAPSLQLSATQGTRGQIIVGWSAIDPQINIATLKLEVVEPGASQWTPMKIASTPTGKTTWPVRKAGLVAIRGTVTDLAGNIQRAQAQVRVTDSNRRVPRPAVPDFRQPIADRFESTPDEFSNSEPQPTEFPETTPDVANVQQRVDAIPPQFPDRKLPHEGDEPDPALADNRVPQFPGLDQTTDSTSLDGALVSDQPDARPPLFQGRYPRTEQSSDSRLPRRVVRSRQFHIDYKIEDVGPSGVSRVELYITQDGGKKWWKYGNDRDRQSPFHVEVPEDASYGFALRVKSGAGLSDPPPRPSDTPDIVVVVDQTAPIVKLLPVKQGQGAESNQVQIRWTIDEDNPARLPVALFFAGSPQGPWEPISGWQPDRGSHLWKVGKGLPPRIYIRVTARDEAGNTTNAETSKPVLIDLSRPSARIVNVELIESNGFQP
jgi:hypothetical protein